MTNNHHHEPLTPEAVSGRLAGAVLGRIKAEQIAPTPRWHFIFSELAMWVLWVATAALGAVAVTVMMYVSLRAGYAFYEATHESYAQFLLETAPVMWLLFFLVMAAVGYLNLRHTKRGYRYPVWYLLVSSFLVSVVGGAALHSLGAGQLIESLIERTMPMYHSFEAKERRWWQAPEAGRLVGTFEPESIHDGLVTFIDIKNNQWTVAISELNDIDLSVLNSGQLVRLIGVPATSTDPMFYGCGVFPWLHDKPPSLATMRHDRESFVRRVHEVKERVARQFEAFPQGTTSPPLLPMGICPTMPLIQKMP